MSPKILRTAFVVTALCLGPFGVSFCAATDYLYPDIIPFVREDQPYLVNWDISGTNLRMQTVYANVGDGLFEIRSGPVLASDPNLIQVLQRVYIGTDAGANYQDFPANAAVAGHIAHGHLHFEDFSMFELLSVTTTGGVLGVGSRIAGGIKSSYRLSDGVHLPDPQWSDKPSFPSSNLGTHQRISVGWGDVYSHGTVGQSFSIASVPVGPLYWLRQTVDPDNVVLETDESNNSFEILIDLSKQGQARTFANKFLRPGDLVPPRDGDLNGDGFVNLADWAVFKVSIDSSLDGLTSLQAFQLGDLDFDGTHEIGDFIQFRQAYVGSGGVASDLTWDAVPEPSSIVLLLIGLAGSVAMARRVRAKSRNVGKRPVRPVLRGVVAWGELPRIPFRGPSDEFTRSSEAWAVEECSQGAAMAAACASTGQEQAIGSRLLRGGRRLGTVVLCLAMGTDPT